MPREKVKLEDCMKDYETLFKNEWIEVRERDAYTYIRDGETGRFVAVLCYSFNPYMLLGRFEECPPHEDGIALCALTGGVKEGEKSSDAAVRELYEEAGVKKRTHDLISLGSIRLSKLTDSVGYLYACIIDYEDKVFKGPGDGTKHEDEAYCQFVTERQCLFSKDPVLITMVSRLNQF